MLPSVGLGVQHFLMRKKKLEKLEVKTDGFFKTLTHTILYLVFLPVLTVKRTFTRAYLLLKLAFLEPNNTKLRKQAQDLNKITTVLERFPEGILGLYILYSSDNQALHFSAITALRAFLAFLVCIYALSTNASKRNFFLLFISLALELGYRWMVLFAIIFMNKTVGGVMIGVLSLMYFCNICLNGTGIEDGVYDWIGSYSSPLLTEISEL